MNKEETNIKEKSPPDKEAGTKKKKKRTATSYAIEFFIKIGVTAIAVWALCTFVISININHSNSGYPMIKDGDLCISYRLAKLVLSDEISYRHDGKVSFGRVVAKSGDIVDIREDAIIVNGYDVFEDTVYPTTAEGAKIEFPYTVPQDSVFVLNDYRSDVNDSRSFGALPVKEALGKVILVIRRREI